MEQLTFVYVAFLGLPYWSSYFYVIDLAKQNYFIDLVKTRSYEEAEQYLNSNKFMNSFFGPGLPMNLHIKFGGFSWTEYQRCFADACYIYLLDVYHKNDMLRAADELRRLPKWWLMNISNLNKPHLLRAEYNDFVVDYLKCHKPRPAEEKITTKDQFYALSYPALNLSGVKIYDQAETVEQHFDAEDLLILKDGEINIPLKQIKNGSPTFGLDNSFLSTGYYHYRHFEKNGHVNENYKLTS